MASNESGGGFITRKSAFNGENDVTEDDEGVSTLWKNFSENTGFHAVNKLSPGRNCSIRCLWWTLVISGMAGYLLYTVISELQHYYSYPMRTDFRIETKREIPFPAVTFCNQSPLNGTAMGANDTLNNFFMSQYRESWSKPINWSDTETYGEFYTTEHSVDWWRAMSVKIEALTRVCMFNGLMVNCSDVFVPVFTEVGLCFTFNGNISSRLNVSLSGADNNLVIIILAMQEHYLFNKEMSAGYKILLHDPEQHPDSVRSGILASPGFSTYISMKKTVYKYLPSPHKAFGDTECLDTTSASFNNTLKYHDYYTYEHCLLECASDAIFQKCGCVMPNDSPLGPICSFKVQALCYARELRYTRTNATAQDKCGCVKTCSTTSYDAHVSTAQFPSQLWNTFLVNTSIVPDETFARNNALELRIFYNQMVVESVEQVPIYKTATIVANLGGQMGICLGASVLTLTELGEFLLFLFLYILHRVKPSNHVTKISIK